MADRTRAGDVRRGGRWARASVRMRTTLAAVLVVALAEVIGAFLLVSLVRDSLHDGIETTAEQRATGIAQELDTTGLPPAPGADADDDDDDDELGADPDSSPEDPDDLVWQIRDEDGAVVRSSQPLAEPLPAGERDSVRLAGSENDYVVVVTGAEDYQVVVAASLEEVADSTAALVPALLGGLVAMLFLVGGTTWVVVTRALAPVERIRSEVDQITGTELDRRVPVPPSRDEINRLARTMNEMLQRLEVSRDRQQQFVADASHELRSPLASILQAAEVSARHPDALPQAELSALVAEESRRMQRLVEQLLLLTRADEGVLVREPREVDLDDLLLAEASRVRRDGLEVDTSGVVPTRVQGDPVALAQVVRNLVDNAARHASGRLRLAVAAHGDSVRVVVEDDGNGVPEDQRERVFERFVRLDEARARDDGGSGLGLAIVRETVQAHGGQVRVERGDLGGARFVVGLPAG